MAIHDDLLRVDDEVCYWAQWDGDKLTTFEKVVLTLEDRRFFSHSGFDFFAIIRIIWRKLTFRNHGGASTIDMQFVRVSTGRYQRTLKRKLYEIFLSYIIQFRYSKIIILRSYIDIAYFGTGLRGGDSAAWREFNKYSRDLDARESALIASQLVFPRPRIPSAEWTRRRLRRANYIMSLYPRYEKRFDKL